MLRRSRLPTVREPVAILPAAGGVVRHHVRLAGSQVSVLFGSDGGGGGGGRHRDGHAGCGSCRTCFGMGFNVCALHAPAVFNVWHSSRTLFTNLARTTTFIHPSAWSPPTSKWPSKREENRHLRPFDTRGAKSRHRPSAQHKHQTTVRCAQIPRCTPKLQPCGAVPDLRPTPSSRMVRLASTPFWGLLTM